MEISTLTQDEHLDEDGETVQLSAFGNHANNVKGDPGNDMTLDIDIDEEPRTMLYHVTDNPPWTLSVGYALQVVITQMASFVSVSIMVNDVVCGDSAVKSKLMSTTLLMGGLCTFLQSSIGVRLPVFQGPTFVYLLSMMSRSETDWACPGVTSSNSTAEDAVTMNVTDGGEEEWRRRILDMSGSLMMISLVHTLLGLFGIIGYVVKYIGPLTIIPALTLIILEVVKKLIGFAEIHWGIAAFTGMLTLVLSSYIGDTPIPFPIWTRKRGWHIVWSKILRSFAIVIGLLFGWLLAFILTKAGAITDDPASLHYNARTDAQQSVVDMADWFYVPYPGQYGMPRFNGGIFFAFIAAMLTSVLDSVGDYLACAKICRIPKPPPHATNRGIVVEGLCSILSGAFGACHATTTYSALIGMLALTGVASRIVFVISGCILMLLGVLGKLAAFFVIIPKPVLAATGLLSMSSLLGMCIQVMEDVDMSRPRNIMSFGFAVVMGKGISDWVNLNHEQMKTGNDLMDQLILALLGNPMFLGGFLGCLLDNSLPGKSTRKPMTKEDEKAEDDDEDKKLEKLSSEIYDLPFISNRLRKCRWTRYVPICPGFRIGNMRKPSSCTAKLSYNI